MLLKKVLHELQHTPTMILDKNCWWYSCFGDATEGVALCLLLCVPREVRVYCNKKMAGWKKLVEKWTFLGANTPGHLYPAKEASKQTMSLNAGYYCVGNVLYALERKPACT